MAELVRTNDPEFDDWDDFTTWLEQDPANADVYHALASSEASRLGESRAPACICRNG